MLDGQEKFEYVIIEVNSEQYGGRGAPFTPLEEKQFRIISSMDRPLGFSTTEQQFQTQMGYGIVDAPSIKGTPCSGLSGGQAD